MEFIQLQSSDGENIAFFDVSNRSCNLDQLEEILSEWDELEHNQEEYSEAELLLLRWGINRVFVNIVTVKPVIEEPEEERVTVSLGQLSQSHHWEEFCTRYGYNYYCLNEGANKKSKVEIKITDFKKWLV